MNIKKIKLIFNLTLFMFTLTLPLSKVSAMEKLEKNLNENLNNEETEYCEELTEKNSNDKINSKDYKNKIEEHKKSLNETIKSIEDIFNNQNKITENDKKTLNELVVKFEKTLTILETKINEWYNQICDQIIYDESEKEECDKYLEDYQKYQEKLKLYKHRTKEYEIEEFKNYLNNIESKIKERLNSTNILDESKPTLNTLLEEYGKKLLKLKEKLKELDDYVKECNNDMEIYKNYDNYYDCPKIIDEDVCVEILKKYEDFNKYIENCNENFKNYNNIIREKYKQILNNNTKKISEENKSEGNKIELEQKYKDIISLLDKNTNENDKKIFDEIINSIKTILPEKTNKITKDDEKTLNELIKKYETALFKLKKNTINDNNEIITKYEEILKDYKNKIKKNYRENLDKTIISIKTILNKKTVESTKDDERTLKILIEEYNEILSKLEKNTTEDSKETIKNYKEDLEEYKIKIEKKVNEQILYETAKLIKSILNKAKNGIQKTDKITLDNLIKKCEETLSKLEKKSTEDSKETIKNYKEDLKKYKDRINEIKILPHEKILQNIICFNYSVVEEKKIDEITEEDLENLVISTKIFNDIFEIFQNNIICDEQNKENIMCFKENLEKYENIIERIFTDPLDNIMAKNFTIMENMSLYYTSEEDLNNLIESTNNFKNILNKFKTITNVLCPPKKYIKNKAIIENYEENLIKYKNKIINIYNQMLNYKKDMVISKENKKTLNELLKISPKLNENTTKNYEKTLNEKYEQILEKFTKQNKIISEDDLENLDKVIKNYETTLTQLKKTENKNNNDEKTIEKYENIIKEIKELKKNEYKKIFNEIEECVNNLLNNSLKKTKPDSIQPILTDTSYNILEKLINKYKNRLDRLKKDTDVNDEKTINFYKQKLRKIISNINKTPNI